MYHNFGCVNIVWNVIYAGQKNKQQLADPGERSVLRPPQQDDNVSRDDPNVNFGWMKPISASTEPYT